MKKRNKLNTKKAIITGINLAFLIFAIHGFFSVIDIMRALSLLNYPLHNVYYALFAQYVGLVCTIWLFALLIRDFYIKR